MHNKNSKALDWREGQPYSALYEDVYFSTSSDNPQQGLEETDYVFLQHNQLESRFKSLTKSHFTIAETGFGTGLNFLCACQLWLKNAPSHTRLHFVSVEKHPIALSDMQKAHALWPSLASESSELLSQYSLLTPGYHRFTLFQGRVILTLIIGDASDQLATVNSQVDAWFLDGFSPAKNPDMWQDSLFAQMARLSNEHTTFATFTSAGFVKRGLQSVGFNVKKTTGYGRKRDMLFGQFDPATQVSASHCDLDASRTAVVIGGGIAGCSTAYALAQRGWAVTVIERNDRVASEASGNPKAVLYPRLASHDTAQDRLSVTSFLYTLRLLKSLGLSPDDFQTYGLLQMAFNQRESSRLNEIAKRGFDHDFLSFINSDEASAIAGIHLKDAALYFPAAGWVNPQSFCTALLRHPNIQLMLNESALSVSKLNDEWQVHSNEKRLSQAPVVIIANANDVLSFEQSAHLALTPVRGQVSTVQAHGNSLKLKTVVCTEGYITPADQGTHCLGATFSVGDENTEIREEDNLSNLDMLKAMSADLDDLNQQAINGRAALRCTTSDHLPLIGQLIDVDTLTSNLPKHVNQDTQLPVHKGLYVNVGHGSKGMITAPLCAEVLASQLCNEPLAIDMNLLSAMNANRHILRELGLKRIIKMQALR